MTKEKELMRDIRRIKSIRKGKPLRKIDKQKISIIENSLRVLRDNKRFHRVRYDMLETQRVEIYDIFNGRKQPDKDLDLYSYRLEEIDWELCILWRPAKKTQVSIFNPIKDALEKASIFDVEKLI